MQSLPIEIIAEISSHLKFKDVAHFSSTCKDYRDLLSKEVEEYKNIAEIIKETYYHIISVVMEPEITYDYYVYNIDKAMNFYRQKYPKENY
jgi:hypothetical protein